MDERDRTDEVAEDQKKPRPGPPPGQCAGAVYGFGMIGALVWFWQQAETPGEHGLAVLKAMAWPAFLVYQAFKATSR